MTRTDPSASLRRTFQKGRILQNKYEKEIFFPAFKHVKWEQSELQVFEGTNKDRKG